MAGNTFGTIYRLTTFGESHGQKMGVVIDGCPPGVRVTLQDINNWTDRRRPGKSETESARKESDIPEILSGIHENLTLGTPIAVTVANKDADTLQYEHLIDKFRPGHADYTYFKKYRNVDWRGGGRASARETVGRVIGGAVAFNVLRELCPDLKTSVYVRSVGDVSISSEPQVYDHNIIYDAKNKMRCPDKKIAEKMIEVIRKAKRDGDSVGALLEFVISGVPVGLGEPVFDKLSADIAKALLSIPAAKGIQFGAGFDAAKMLGSDHNDMFVCTDNRITTKTNNAGGLLGGISNGENIYGKIAFKPISTISKDQDTVDIHGSATKTSGRMGGHDPCVASRAVPIVECMLACVVLDHILRNFTVQSVYNQFKKFNIDGSAKLNNNHED